jgi:ABC-type Fe3+-hydroxamate transport system substrate-binding protein
MEIIKPDSYRVTHYRLPPRTHRLPKNLLPFPCMPQYIDQTGHHIQLDRPPQRIVSLVPSQTELLYDLGLRDEVVAITKFCVHPTNWFRSKQRIGGTKHLRLDIIHDLQPDLIIANKEENVKAQVEELASRYPVWTSDIRNPQQAFEMIAEIAQMTGRRIAGKELVFDIKKSVERLEDFIAPFPPQRAIYLIWQEPYMTVGNDTFIHAMMELAGFENLYAHQTRYPEVSLDEMIRQQPAYLLLSSEPFPFQQKHMDELQPHLPNTKILLVDGEMFSWYGSRMLKAASYFQELHSAIGNKQ